MIVTIQRYVLQLLSSLKIWPSRVKTEQVKRVSKSNNEEREQIKEQKSHMGENQDRLSKLLNLEVLPPPVQALGRMEKMRTYVVTDEHDYCDMTNRVVQQQQQKLHHFVGGHHL